MDAHMLLKRWPSWVKASGKTILSSPAWSMKLSAGGEEFTVKSSSVLPEKTLSFNVAFDDEEHILSIGDSPLFGDVHLLWGKIGLLPEELVLALAERECAVLFSLLEKMAKRSFALLSVSSAEAPQRHGFEARSAKGKIDFALDLGSSLATVLGRLEYIDPAHESVTAQTVSARPRYSLPPLEDGDFSSLRRGDFILLGAPLGASVKWPAFPDEPPPAGLALYGERYCEITFAQFAREEFPVPEPPQSLLIEKEGKPAARCIPGKVLEADAIEITSI